MTEKKKHKLKIKNDNILLILFFVLIAVYIAFHIYSALNVEIETVTAVKSTVYETIDTKALVIRDEKLIDEKADELMVSCIDDGAKVGVNGNIAMRFASTKDAANYSKLKQLHGRLDYYIDLQNRNSASVTDIKTLDKDTLEEVNSYIISAKYGNHGRLSDINNKINDNLTKYQLLIGEKVDFAPIIEKLQSQINEIEASSSEPMGYITTPSSGVFSSYVDGFENAFNYDTAEELTVKKLNKYIKTAEQKNENIDNFGKLINSYEWYFCCVVDASDVEGIKNGQLLDVAVKDSDEIISCVVVTGAEVSLGQKQTVLVLKSNRMNSSIASMRLEDIEIRVSSYTGFKLPSSAVHIDEDGKKCVYALVSDKTVVRYSSIIYSTKDFVIMYDEKPNSNSIRYYDQIITKGKELHDGKDYS